MLVISSIWNIFYSTCTISVKNDSQIFGFKNIIDICEISLNMFWGIFSPNDWITLPLPPINCWLTQTLTIPHTASPSIFLWSMQGLPVWGVSDVYLPWISFKKRTRNIISWKKEMISSYEAVALQKHVFKKVLEIPSKWSQRYNHKAFSFSWFLSCWPWALI